MFTAKRISGHLINKRQSVLRGRERRGIFLRQSITCLKPVASACSQKIQYGQGTKTSIQTAKIRSKLRMVIPKLASYYRHNWEQVRTVNETVGPDRESETITNNLERTRVNKQNKRTNLRHQTFHIRSIPSKLLGGC